MTTEELKVVLRRSENSGFGFSLLGTTGPPHVIYDIVENSPAADCGAVEAGDVILKVNGTDVHRYTTKEVLKCLRLSDDLVTLELKRDPKLKAHIKEQLANTKGPHYVDTEIQNNYNYHSNATASSSTYYVEAAKCTSLSSHNYEQTIPTANFPASRCKIITTTTTTTTTTETTLQNYTAAAGTVVNMTYRHQMVSPSHNHSRNSSGSSVKIQVSENNTTNYTGAAISQNATSPTSRPSRIPQAVKCSQKMSPGHTSPHQKRSRPSQIPTKAGLSGSMTGSATHSGNTSVSSSSLAVAVTTAITTTVTTTARILQHSNSYSDSHVTDGGCNFRHRSQYTEERDAEPISAPPQPIKPPRFEAYMMTGDLILNLSRTPQNSNLLPMQAKKVDSLRDSIIKPPTAIRPNGALAPKASGESSPTSSSSIESPNHTASLGSGDNMSIKDKSRLHNIHAKGQQQTQFQLQRNDSFNNSCNNRKDSLTNDTLQMCEELERDDGKVDVSGQSSIHQQSRQQQHQQQQHLQQQQKQQQQRQRQRQQQQFAQNKQNSIEQYDQNDREIAEIDNYNYDRQTPPPFEYDNEDEEENEEDQTNYDITNLETYDSGGCAGGDGVDYEASDRQFLLQYDGEDSISTKQHLNALKKRAALRHKERINQDTVDSTRNVNNSGSSSTSTTVGGTSVGGANTSQDETSFSVPTSPISLSTPLIDKETANSVPTSPEPTNMASGAITADCNASGVAVVRRHNGIVRTCDSAGFRTSKSEDHLQQIQREGMAAIIPIDIDEDVNSSLNTLLDTRQDSEDSQPSTSTVSQSSQSTIKLNNGYIFNNNNNNSYNNDRSNRKDKKRGRSVIFKRDTMKFCASPEAHNQRDIFNKRRRKVRKCTAPSSNLVTARNPMKNAMAIPTTMTTITASTGNSNALTPTPFKTRSQTITTTTITTSTTSFNTANITTTATINFLGPNNKASNRDRIVWTYNAPLQPHQLAAIQHQQQYSSSSHHGQHTSINNSYHTSHSSSISSSPQNSIGSPASPTSVSSSVMSSSGSRGALGIVTTNYSLNSESMPQHQQQQQQQQQQHQHQKQQQRQHQAQQPVIVSNGSLITSTNIVGTVTMNLGLLHCPNGSNSIASGGYGNLNANTSGGGGGGGGGDHSVSEAISNISSPDYQDDDNLLSSRDLLGGMVLSDPSDSDSTILVSEAAIQRQQQHRQKQQKTSEHKVVIQVRGADSLHTNTTNNNQSSSPKSLYAELKDSEDELATLMADINASCNISNNSVTTLTHGDNNDSSPPISDDGSDVESLHSYHYSPKAVDMPSAIRLAKRLYSLDGFKKSDVSRHLSKNNDFSRAVADEYLKYFNFEQKTLDQSLREFLQQFSLSGETQERERVLVHFSKRYLDCNPGSFNSQDAVHTLTCAIMLLNTDLHGQNIGRKMSCAEFIENLTELNDGDNFPKDILKYLYQAIKSQPLEWALDDDTVELQKQLIDNKQVLTGSGSNIGQNPFLHIPESSTAVEYKKGYVMRKCCYDANYKKTPFGKRSWKMFYCTLRDLVLYLHKDEHGFRKSQMSDNLHNAIRIHHALACKASDYTKKQHVFRLQTADQAEYLFQTSDSKELQSWVETINFVCAAYSAPSLEAGVGSQKRFQRPLLPSTHTKLLMKEQLEAHEKLLTQLENSLVEHRKGCMPSKGLALQNYKEKENYLQYELRRYKTYVSILNAKVMVDQQQLDLHQQQLHSNQLIEEAEKFPKRLTMQTSTSTSTTLLTANTNNIINASHQIQTQQLSSITQSANRWFLCGCGSFDWWSSLFS